MSNAVSRGFAINAAVLGALALALGACQNPEPGKAKEIVELGGYSDVTMTGYAPYGCGQDDTYHDGFTARGANGMCVSGVVCSAPLKGSTVRIIERSDACPARPEAR